jgi:hypothetical protein
MMPAMNRVRPAEKLSCVVATLVALIASANSFAAQDASLELFTNGVIPRIRLTIPPESVAGLRKNPRQDVSATVREGTNVWPAAGVHLKGSIGSFRGIDGKPALTLSFDKFSSTQRFHGLRKIHLNNSVEDPSYMNELVGSEMFRAAGVPAPLVTHAIVEMNDRQLGLYVLKEGFAEEFLGRHFRHPKGNLYDLAVGGHDVNEPMAKYFGTGPNDHSDLAALTDAAVEPDLPKRWLRLQSTLDMERFISFMSMEIMLGHRDGYCLARNNFRIYQDVDSGRMIFLPHGMDQLFGNARALIEPRMNGIVARAVMETPEGRRAYRVRRAVLLTNVFRFPRIDQTVDGAATRLRSVLAPNDMPALQRETAQLKERIRGRIAEVEKQIAQPPMELLRFESGIAKLSGWQPFDLPEGGSMAQTNTPDRKRALMIRAGPVTSASWRTKVLLPLGQYRFEGLAKTASVEPLAFGKNHGVMLRVTQVPAARPPPLLGTQPWKTLQVLFETTEREQEVELVCELRGRKGTAWFDLDSLRMVQR